MTPQPSTPSTRVADPLPPAAFEFVGADLGYERSPVVRDVRLRVEEGEFVGAVGPSGSGKSTLIRALTGRCRVFTGAVRIFGKVAGRGVSGAVGYVPQIDTVDLSFPITVEQVVLQGFADGSPRLPRPTPAERDAVADVLGRLRLDDLARRPLARLSGGELQRTFLARALVRTPRLILLDEPTSGVDLKTRHDVLHLLGELHGSGVTIFITTHDLNFVAAHLPRLVCLNRRIVADGPPSEVFTREVIAATYGADVHVIREGRMVFVVDPTHLLTPESHHDEPGHDHALLAAEARESFES